MNLIPCGQSLNPCDIPPAKDDGKDEGPFSCQVPRGLTAFGISDATPVVF